MGRSQIGEKGVKWKKTNPHNFKKLIQVPVS